MNSPLHVTFVAAALVGLGCDAAPPATSDAPATDRAPIGKADFNDGSCAAVDGDYCGGPSDGACYCDADCVRYGDCCADVSSVCEADAAPEVIITGLDAPESIVFDAGSQTYFVTNLAHNILETDPLNPPEGNVGFVSRHRLDGSVVAERWAEGFSSPKGMAIADGILYVADPKAIVALDIKDGREVARYTEPAVGLFNDVAAADDGTLYATDTANPGVYRIDPRASKSGTPQRVVSDERFEFPNGLAISGKTLYVATTGLLPSAESMGTVGRLFTVDSGTYAVREIEGVHGKWDGVAVLSDDLVVVNDFMSGEVTLVDLRSETSERLLESPIAFEMPPSGIADMGIAGSTLLLPSMFTNEIWAYAPDLEGKTGK